MPQTPAILATIAMTLVVSACSSSTGSSAAVNSTSASTVAQANADDPIVCENYIPAGTRVAKKVCMRQSVIDRNREQAQTITQENQRRAVLGSPTGN